MILVKVYAACGLCDPAFDPRPYSPQWHLHRGEEMYQAWLDKAGAIETGAPRPGDIGLWKFGRAYSHAAILVSEADVVHALMQAGRVVIGSITEQPLANRPVKWFTVFKD